MPPTYTKSMKRAASLILIFSLVLALFSLSACSSQDPTFDEISAKYADLAKNATVSRCDGDVTVDFGKTVTVNRLVLRERGSSVSSFTLSVPGATSPFYGNDFIGGYRYCAFPAVTADRITVSSQSDSVFDVASVEAYFIPPAVSPFSVTSYITAKYAYSPILAAAPSDVLDLIYAVYLNKDGETVLPDYYIDGERIDGEKVVATCVANIRSAFPGARILLTVLGDRDFDGDGLTLQQRCSAAFAQKEKLTRSLLSLLSVYGADGISFDYEYPVSASDYYVFADFCAYFRQKLQAEKLLSAAISAWCVDEKRLSAQALAPFDRLVLMAYDEKDARGCHSTFYTAYSQLWRLKKKGVPLHKVLLGIPLYSKPLDGTSCVSAYSDYADILPFFSNTAAADCGGELKPCYFNGRQLVADKTALAKDVGLCGVAAWHYSLDSDDPALSLLATAERAANSFR